MNAPTMVNILTSVTEAPHIKTFTFHYPLPTQPGQFYMVWIPGIDEIPMSVSVLDKEIKGITFRAVGDATKALFKLTKGDLIGIRGPYGNGFHPKGNHLLFVGGGTGTAMLAPAVEQTVQQGGKATGKKRWDGRWPRY